MSFEAKQKEDRDTIQQRLQDRCTVTYYVHGKYHEKEFQTCQEAVDWVVEREEDGAQWTDEYQFDDRAHIKDNVYIWQLATSRRSPRI